MEKKKYSLARILAECAAMVALATILSILKMADLPYGGSITMASMLPLVIVSYRHGTKWGLISSFVYGAIELVLGLKTLSYVTGVASVVAVILLDYIVAFGVIGLSGLVRKMKVESTSLVLGSLIACTARYICHVISGATVWAGLSIPTAAALTYSFIYNATYMLPETLILMAVAFFIGSSIDFNSDRPKPVVRVKKTTSVVTKVLKVLAMVGISAAFVIDVVAVFSKLQNAESGEFDITGLSNVNVPLVIIPTAIALVLAAAFITAYVIERKKKVENQNDVPDNSSSS